MDKYIKLEDAMEVHRHFATNGRLAANIIEEYNNLPTIEVMEYPQVDGITPTVITPEVSEEEETPTCSGCDHYEDHHTSLACANCPVITKTWGGAE